MRKVIAVIFIALVCCKTERKDEPEPSAVLHPPKKVIEEGEVRLEIYDYDGFERFLKQKDEKIHVINFWATWCKPCVEELPYFEQLHKEYKDKGVEVLLVSIDMPNMITSQLIPFMENRKLQSKVIVLDDTRQNMWISKIDEDWSGAIPATLIYNKHKKAFFEQSFTYPELEEQVSKFLNP